MVEESLTLINSTRNAVQENRQQINEIVGALVTLSVHLKTYLPVWKSKCTN